MSHARGRSVFEFATHGRINLFIRSVRLLLPFLIAALSTQSVAAQSNGRVSGTVRDTAGRPLGGVTISVDAGARAATTDQTGSFVIVVPAGDRTLKVRNLGYRRLDTLVVVLPGEEVRLAVVLTRFATSLDTVRTIGERHCIPFSAEGFACRRGHAAGTFIDARAMDSLAVRYPAELFENNPALRIVPRNAPPGSPPLALESRTGWHCLVEMVDAKPVVLNPDDVRYNPIPVSPKELIAIEFYDSAKNVPAELRRFATQRIKGIPTPCALIMYWTSGSIRQ